MNEPPFSQPVTPKELAHHLPGRDARSIRRLCRMREIETLPLGIPYLIPAHEANRILAIENARDEETSTR